MTILKKKDWTEYLITWSSQKKKDSDVFRSDFLMTLIYNLKLSKFDSKLSISHWEMYMS